MISFQSKPITFLPTFAEIFPALVKITQDEYEELLEAQLQPYLLDDQLIEYLLKFYQSEQKEEFLWEKQLELWQELKLTAEQQRKIRILREQVEQLSDLNQKILRLVESLSPYTLNKLLAKDENEFGLKLLLEESSSQREFEEKPSEADEIMESLMRDYTKIRSSLTLMIPKLLTQIPRCAIEACAKKLNLYQDERLLVQTSDEALVLLDYCLFHYRPEGRNLVEKHLETHFPSLSEEEIAVYGVLKHAFFTVLRVEAALREGGLAVYDLLRGEFFILFDDNLSQTTKRGMLIVCHLINQPGFVLTTGAAIPVSLSSQAVGEILNYVQTLSLLNVEKESSEITKLATEIFKACIWNNLLLPVEELDEFH